jgi:N-acetylglucosaminyldiphosphoundecaprenol N-acetyl-beta-D-mannosaminyltransferase
VLRPGWCAQIIEMEFIRPPRICGGRCTAIPFYGAHCALKDGNLKPRSKTARVVVPTCVRGIHTRTHETTTLARRATIIDAKATSVATRTTPSANAATATVAVLGLDVVTDSLQGFATALLERARAGQGAYVVTVNLEHIARAERDPAYAAMLRAADLRCPDGAPVFWACRAGGAANDNCERIAGVDLVATMLRGAAGLRIAIVGGRDPRRALEKLDVPAARLCYLNTAAIGTDPRSLVRLSADVAVSRPDLVFVALGVPRQDIVGLALRDAIPGAVVVGVGGSFEILAGIKPRAPRWVQSAGFEWLFRLSLEPARLFSRYFLVYPVAVRRLARWALFERRPARASKPRGG